MAIKKLKEIDYSSLSDQEILEIFNTSIKGLTEEEANKRLELYGYNEFPQKKRTLLFQILSKFSNPLVIVLLIIALSSLFFGEKINAFLVMVMAFISVFLSFIQEYRATKETEKLSEMVRTTTTVYRNGKPKDIPIKNVVIGDIVDLFAGDMIPADLRIIYAKDLFINQSAFTGESFPVEKTSEPINVKNPTPTNLTNIAFMGSSVVSGTGLGVVIRTGQSTQFGNLFKKLSSIAVESSFDKGIKNFTYLMIRFMLLLIFIIFGINVLTKKGILDSFLFSLSVAVGLTPEMLPMLVAINLSKGAIYMSKKQVIVKRLNAIQNFGAMDVLCTDKTGTLTLDKIVLEKHCDVIRKEDEDVLRLAYINSYYQTGLRNILDRAILKYQKIVVKQYKKIDEIPFDFSRKMMSIVVEWDGKHRLITKGAPEEIYKRCTKFELEGEIFELDKANLLITELKEEYNNLSSNGFRVLAIAYRDFDKSKERYTKEDEYDLILKGYVAFLDPPKPTAKKTIERLKKFGINFKVLTGDNELVTKKICSDVGLNIEGFITGEELEKISDEELKNIVEKINVFARLSPFQKERVITALHKNNHVVGYLGDGINDALALKAADVGISVNNAVDIAKESADIILLKKSLLVLEDGVKEGRKTFGNILKYIKMGASSNLGNMISVTGASLFLPFLPMLPIQILLNNLLYDISQIAIPSDDVDKEYLLKSRPWNINYIKKFMLTIGPVSSLFDFITFAVLLFIFKYNATYFRTGWFLESLCTQTLVIHIIRTGKIPFIESKSSAFLLFTSLYIVTIAILIPYLPIGKYFNFVPLSINFFIALIIIVALYLYLTHLVKSWFIKKYGYE